MEALRSRKNLFFLIISLLFVGAFSSILRPPAWVEGGILGYNPSGRSSYSAIQSSNKRDLWLFGGFDCKTR